MSRSIQFISSNPAHTIGSLVELYTSYMRTCSVDIYSNRTIMVQGTVPQILFIQQVLILLKVQLLFLITIHHIMAPDEETPTGSASENQSRSSHGSGPLFYAYARRVKHPPPEISHIPAHYDRPIPTGHLATS